MSDLMGNGFTISTLVTGSTLRVTSESKAQDLLADVNTALGRIETETTARRGKVETILVGLSLAGEVTNEDVVQVNRRYRQILDPNGKKDSVERLYGIADQIVKHTLFPYSTKRKGLLGLRSLVERSIKYNCEVLIPYVDIAALDFILSDAFVEWNERFHQRADLLEFTEEQKAHYRKKDKTVAMNSNKANNIVSWGASTISSAQPTQFDKNDGDLFSTMVKVAAAVTAPIVDDENDSGTAESECVTFGVPPTC